MPRLYILTTTDEAPLYLERGSRNEHCSVDMCYQMHDSLKSVAQAISHCMEDGSGPTVILSAECSSVEPDSHGLFKGTFKPEDVVTLSQAETAAAFDAGRKAFYDRINSEQDERLSK